MFLSSRNSNGEKKLQPEVIYFLSSTYLSIVHMLILLFMPLQLVLSLRRKIGHPFSLSYTMMLQMKYQSTCKDCNILHLHHCWVCCFLHSLLFLQFHELQLQVFRGLLQLITCYLIFFDWCMLYFKVNCLSIIIVYRLLHLQFLQ